MSTPQPSPSWNWRSVVLTVVAMLCAGLTITVAIVDDNGGGGHRERSVTFKVDSADKDSKPDKTVTLDETAQKVLKEQQADHALGDEKASESDLHEKKLPPPEIKAKAKKIQPPGQPEIPAKVPLAAATQPGCTSMFVRNKSSRGGAPVLFGFIHWTGSVPTSSTAGGLAIVRWFDTPAAQASSNYIDDQKGRCWYTVPETEKAWTQANANLWSVSVEITNAGVQPLLQTTAARNAVIRLMRGWHQRWKIPYRHGLIRQGKNNTCVPVRSGFLAHRDAGPCGGGHPDVGTFDMDGLIRDAARGQVRAPLTKPQQRACDLLNYHRRRAHRIGRWYPSRRHRADELKKQIPVGRCLSKYRKR